MLPRDGQNSTVRPIVWHEIGRRRPNLGQIRETKLGPGVTKLGQNVDRDWPELDQMSLAEISRVG